MYGEATLEQEAQSDFDRLMIDYLDLQDEIEEKRKELEDLKHQAILERIKAKARAQHLASIMDEVHEYEKRREKQRDAQKTTRTKRTKAETGRGLTPAGLIMQDHEGKPQKAAPTKLPNGRTLNMFYCPDDYTRSGKLRPYKPTDWEKEAFANRERAYRAELAKRKEQTK